MRRRSTRDDIFGSQLSAAERDAFIRFRYGPGVFEVDWALDAPIPWTAEGCSRAATVHLGGTFDEIAASEDAVTNARPHPGTTVRFARAAEPV